jgi:hypothetical protein
VNTNQSPGLTKWHWYSYWLGGKDHYLADREAGEEVARLRPEVVAAARANRAFGQRVTGYAAAGLAIRQFLDIGAGLPRQDRLMRSRKRSTGPAGSCTRTTIRWSSPTAGRC